MDHQECLAQEVLMELLDLLERWVQLVNLVALDYQVFLEQRETLVVMVQRVALVCKVPGESQENLECLENLVFWGPLERMEAMERKEDLECLELLDLQDFQDQGVNLDLMVALDLLDLRE